MKLKVLKIFRDKYTNERYEVGSIIEPTNERAKEMLSAKGELVEVIAGEETTPNVDAPAPKTKRRR